MGKRSPAYMNWRDAPSTPRPKPAWSCSFESGIFGISVTCEPKRLTLGGVLTTKQHVEKAIAVLNALLPTMPD